MKILLLLLSLNTIEFKVIGLTCSMCSFSTQKSLNKLDFIENITPNLEETSYILEVKDDMFVDFNLIQERVEDAGFFVDKKSIIINMTNKNNYNIYSKQE
jgi:cation transport ATPase